MYRWEKAVVHFDMKVRVAINDTIMLVSPTTKWQTKEMPSNVSKVVVDPNFYVIAKETE